jgi:probable rRNA maturation factor
MHINFSNQVPYTARLPRAVLSNVLLRAQKLLKHKMRGNAVSIVFVSPKESRWLNNKYRGKNKPTNVLSFTLDKNRELGDIIICPNIARKEADKLGIGFNRRVTYLFVHGLLHLLGFHHISKKEERRMDTLTQKILAG